MAFELVAHTPSDVYLPGFREPLQSSRYVDAVAVDVTLIDDHVARIYTDTETDPAIGSDFGLATGQFTLYFESAAYCVGGAIKLDQKSVAHRPDQPTVMLGDLGLDQILDIFYKLNVCPFFINAH
jgi:hypothetical protein